MYILNAHIELYAAGILYTLYSLKYFNCTFDGGWLRVLKPSLYLQSELN